MRIWKRKLKYCNMTLLAVGEVDATWSVRTLQFLAPPHYVIKHVASVAEPLHWLLMVLLYGAEIK